MCHTYEPSQSQNSSSYSYWSIIIHNFMCICAVALTTPKINPNPTNQIRSLKHTPVLQMPTNSNGHVLPVGLKVIKIPMRHVLQIRTYSQLLIGQCFSVLPLAVLNIYLMHVWWPTVILNLLAMICNQGPVSIIISSMHNY